jgi:hypothetical protein
MYPGFCRSDANSSTIVFWVIIAIGFIRAFLCARCPIHSSALSPTPHSSSETRPPGAPG